MSGVSKSKDDFVMFVLDQLSAMEEVRAQPMFGGHGLYAGPAFFGIIHRGHLYFRTNEATRRRYEERGMNAFRPNGRSAMKYHEVPADVLEQPLELVSWAREAILLAHDEPS